jgi:hypothetical protein
MAILDLRDVPSVAGESRPPGFDGAGSSSGVVEWTAAGLRTCRGDGLKADLMQPCLPFTGPKGLARAQPFRLSGNCHRIITIPCGIADVAFSLR